MTQASGGELRAAYEAIQADDLARARDILSAYLVDHPNDPDGWWLYAHAVSDASQGLKALETVVKLDPKYPGAQALIDEATIFDIEPATPEPAKSVRSLSTKPPQPQPAPPAPAQVNTQQNRFVWLVVVIVLLVLVAALALLLPRLGEQGGQTATRVANATETPGSSAGVDETETPQPSQTETETPATDAPTDTPEIATDEATQEPTDEPTQKPSVTPSVTPLEPTTAPTEESVGTETVAPAGSVVEAALSGLSVVPGSGIVIQSSLGNTASADVCSDTSSLRSQVSSAIAALGAAGSFIPAEIGGLAVRFVDCNANQALLRYIGIHSDDARAFAAGEIDEATLRTRIVVNP